MFSARLARWAAALSALSVLLFCASAGAGQRMPGRHYLVGEHRMHLYCEGQGSPTVLFESGLGGIGVEWMDLLKMVAPRSRACVYDRAGYGWSEPGPLPRTAGRAADELAALLDAADIDDQLVIVAHSYGGYVAQTYTRRHPGRVAGLVLVDSSHPAQLTAFPVKRGSYCTALELGYPMRMDLRPRLPAGYPAAWRDTARERMLSLAAAHSQLSELCNYAQSADDAGGDGSAFPPVPVVVVTRGRAEFGSDARGRRLEAAWANLQRDLGHLNERAMQRVATHSGHHVHLDEPDIVVDSTLGSVLFARATQPPSNTRLAAEP